MNESEVRSPAPRNKNQTNSNLLWKQNHAQLTIWLSKLLSQKQLSNWLFLKRRHIRSPNLVRVCLLMTYFYQAGVLTYARRDICPVPSFCPIWQIRNGHVISAIQTCEVVKRQQLWRKQVCRHPPASLLCPTLNTHQLQHLWMPSLTPLHPECPVTVAQVVELNLEAQGPPFDHGILCPRGVPLSPYRMLIIIFFFAFYLLFILQEHCSTLAYVRGDWT